MAASSSGRGVYYGWWVLAAVAVCEMLAYGATTFSAGLFVKPLEAELGVSRADANSSVAIVHIGAGIAAPVMGLLLDRYSLRWIVALGGLCMASGLAIIASTSSLLVMALACALLLSVAFVANGVLTSTTAVSRWFSRRRGRAMGVVAVATSAGGFVIAPLVSHEIEAFGWRGALYAQSALVLSVVLFLALFVIRERPASMGLGDHAEVQGAASDRPRVAPRPVPWTYGRILASRNFWLIGLSTSTLAGAVSAIIVTIPPYASDLGFDLKRAGLLISVLSFAGIATKLTAGWVADLVDRRWILAGGGLALACALGLFLAEPGYWALTGACALTGMALGVIIPAGAALTADRFGADSYGKVYGMMTTLGSVFNVLNVRGVGEVFDRTGDYRLAFLALMGAAAFSALAALFVTRSAGR